VTTAGVPFESRRHRRRGDGTIASVDSELTLLYLDQKTGKQHAIDGVNPQSVFWKKRPGVSHPEFPIYLVTRLAAYDFDGRQGHNRAFLVGH